MKKTRAAAAAAAVPCFACTASLAADDPSAADWHEPMGYRHRKARTPDPAAAQRHNDAALTIDDHPFESDGRELDVEVKTTSFGQHTPRAACARPVRAPAPVNVDKHPGPVCSL